MPPEITSDVDLFTESEIEFKPVDESDYFSSDVREFEKKFTARAMETDSELDSKPNASKTRRVFKRKYDCVECSESFSRKTQYDRHIFKHTGIVSNFQFFLLLQCIFPENT